MKHIIQLGSLALLGTGIAFASGDSLERLPLDHLEARLHSIDTQLLELANNSLRSGVGNLGWVSEMHKEQHAGTTEWAQVHFGDVKQIDQVVLAPVIWRESKTGYQSDGFPRTFKIIAGTDAEGSEVTLADFTEADAISPRVAPLVISIPPTAASWLRIEAAPEPSQVWDGTYSVQLSELLVFEEHTNVALQQPVEVSSTSRNPVRFAIRKDALVDGNTPYVIDAAEGAKSEPCIAFYKAEIDFHWTIDLGHPQPIQQAILHTADIRENVPRIHHADYGIPTHLVVEAANQADFSDAVHLIEYQRTNLYQTGSTLTLNVPDTTARYIRFTALDGYQAPEALGVMSCFGLAEIELLSNGHNVALGQKVLHDETQLSLAHGRPANLTDGRNHYGQLLPLKQWLNQLALRHDLENERPKVIALLNSHYAQQKTTLRIMYWISGLLIITVIFVILIGRIVRLRQMAELKQRFAADMHDELGANLHSIGLISDLAQDADTTEEWQSMGQRIRDLTERTSTALRHCTNMLDYEELYIGLVTDMRRHAERISTNLEHTIEIEGERYLETLKPRTRADLFLFYKESLVNISKHSGATKIQTRLIADTQQIALTIRDNGIGLPDALRNTAPKSLKRRAQLLKAKLNVTSSPEGGTLIDLTLKQK